MLMTCGFFITVLLFQNAICWKLDFLGIDEDKVKFSRIAVYLGHRAFVSIPRVHDEQRVTLVELPWPEYSLSSSYNTKPFPDLESQTIRNCSQLQSAITLDIDNSGRLYVLDEGLPDFCPLKLIVYDVKTGKELVQQELRGVPTDNLKALTVDVNPIDSNVRVILGDAGNNSLLVYNLNGHTWWRLQVTNSFIPESNFVGPTDQFKSIVLNQFAISKYTSTLYATSSDSNELYAMNLEDFRHLEEPLPIFCNNYDYNGTEMSVTYIGDKFGPSSALHVDFRGNLYYIYEPDLAILKWNPNKPFTAENIEVILQDETLMPSGVQVFSGPLFQVWVLNSRKNEKSLYTVKIKSLSFL